MKRARQDTTFDEEACICDVACVIRHHSGRVQEELRAQLSADDLRRLLLTLMDCTRPDSESFVLETQLDSQPESVPLSILSSTFTSVQAGINCEDEDGW